MGSIYSLMKSVTNARSRPHCLSCGLFKSSTRDHRCLTIAEKIKRPLADRFNEKYKRGRDCWLWFGATDGTGYGKMMTGSRTDSSQRLVPAHRISYEIHYGSIDPGLLVLHKCDTPKCVRPDHLYLGTQKQNVHDAIRRGRFRAFLSIETLKRMQEKMNRNLE